jgi:hypothetical protein
VPSDTSHVAPTTAATKLEVIAAALLMTPPINAMSPDGLNCRENCAPDDVARQLTYGRAAPAAPARDRGPMVWLRSANKAIGVWGTSVPTGIGTRQTAQMEDSGSQDSGK